MSRERELLERLLSNWEHPCSGRFGDLFDEVRELLSTPEPKQDEEPVAWTNRQEINALTEECTVYMYAEPMEGEDNIPLYLHPAQRPEPEPEQEQEQLELIGELHPNGLVDFVNDEIPIHHVFPVKLYAKGEALINEIAKCNSDILLGKDHPAPRPEFVRLSEEEIEQISKSTTHTYNLISLTFARAIESALEKKNK